MNPEHAPQFEVALAAAYDLYGGPRLTDATLCLWWQALEPYPWPLVAAALQDHVARCKFAPKPADLRERLEQFDGRPTADEAWAVAVSAHDETVTVVWSQETAEAWGCAAPILALGDGIGARRAFIDRYRRLVDEARRALVPVTWSVSLGTDPQRRTSALQQALARRQLPRARVQALVPDLTTDPGIQAASGLLTGTVTPFPDLPSRNAQRFIAIVRAAIGHRRQPPAANGPGASTAVPDPC